MDNITATIAANLQTIRKERKMTLQDLADLTGVSKSMLGEIERASSNPTINVVWKIANGLKVPISTLIHEPAPAYNLVKESERKTFDRGTYVLSMIFECDKERNFEVSHVEFLPRLDHVSTGHSPGVVEYMMLYSGALTIIVDGEPFKLEAGDSLVFETGDKPHIYRNTGDVPAKAFSMICYPQ